MKLNTKTSKQVRRTQQRERFSTLFTQQTKRSILSGLKGSKKTVTTQTRNKKQEKFTKNQKMEKKLPKNSQSFSAFGKLQTIIRPSLSVYKSMLTPERISKLKPNFSGKVLIHLSEEQGFQKASIEVYRMLMRGKILKNQPKNLKRLKISGIHNEPWFFSQNSLEAKIEPEPQSEREREPTSHNNTNSRSSITSKDDIPGSLAEPAPSSFQVFFPEHMIELTSWSSKTTSSSFHSNTLLTVQVIRLTDVEGNAVLLRGETQSATHDLWEYFYNKSVQFSLPNYIKVKDGDGDAENEFGDDPGMKFYLIKHEVTKEFGLGRAWLGDFEGVNNLVQKWLFDLNVDHIENLGFDRTSCVFLVN